MILSLLLRRSSVVAALLVGGSLLAAPALAGEAAAVGASAKLSVQKPTVAVRAWNGRKVTATSGAARNSQHPDREADPMAIHVTGAHPDTQISFERQKQTPDIELPATVAGEHELQEAAEKHAHYVPMVEFKTKSPSAVQPHVHQTHEEGKVAWPNTRYVVRGKTRDGQRLPHTTGIVEGVNDQSASTYDPVANEVVEELISGRVLPSARAWIKAHNLFVSEPTRDQGLINEGNELVKGAAQKKVDSQKLTHGITVEQGRDVPDTDKMSQMEVDAERLLEEAAQDETSGQAKIIEGQKIKVRVISVAATPASAHVKTVNKRLAGEGTGLHTATTLAHEYSGYAAHDIEALSQDHLETSVHFPSSSGSVGSSYTVSHRVPNHDDKASFEMHGIKFFRVEADSVLAHHDTPLKP